MALITGFQRHKDLETAGEAQHGLEGLSNARISHHQADLIGLAELDPTAGAQSYLYRNGALGAGAAAASLNHRLKPAYWVGLLAWNWSGQPTLLPASCHPGSERLVFDNTDFWHNDLFTGNGHSLPG